MSGLKIFTFLVGHRGPHEDPSRAGCGPRGGRFGPLFYTDLKVTPFSYRKIQPYNRDRFDLTALGGWRALKNILCMRSSARVTNIMLHVRIPNSLDVVEHTQFP